MYDDFSSEEFMFMWHIYVNDLACLNHEDIEKSPNENDHTK